MMEHKAYLFDYKLFEEELRPILEEALATGDVDDLVRFVEINLAELKEPYEGTKLSQDWESILEYRDAHQYGDVALTKYYDPSADLGLGYHWDKVAAVIEERLGDSRLVLGSPVGPSENLFDPGKQGSYFQSEGDVVENLRTIDRLTDVRTGLDPGLARMRSIFETASLTAKGLYVTF